MPIYLLSPTPKEETTHLPMIEFNLLEENLDFRSCDVLLFTSKQAVISTEELNSQWKLKPCIAIGDATAGQVEEFGGEVIYKPDSFYANTLANDVVTLFEEKKIMYLRPKVVSFDVKSFLESSGLTVSEKIIYETLCVKHTVNKKPIEGSIVIFTSPSTIHCFMKNFEWEESYVAVVIGQSSLTHLPSSVRYKIADEPSITSCITKAQEILTANRL